jgi:hypothetical protein
MQYGLGSHVVHVLDFLPNDREVVSCVNVYVEVTYKGEVNVLAETICTNLTGHIPNHVRRARKCNDFMASLSAPGGQHPSHETISSRNPDLHENIS